MPVIAGTGSNSTHEAVDLTQAAHEAGADAHAGGRALLQQAEPGGPVPALLPRSPRPPTGRSSSTPFPAAAASRSACRVVERLRAKYPHVRWIKEAGGSVDRVDQLKQALGADITVLSGDDSLTLPFMAVGRRGRDQRRLEPLSSREVGQMVRLALADDYAKAAQAAPPALPAVQGALHRAEPGADQGRAGPRRHHRLRRRCACRSAT